MKVCMITTSYPRNADDSAGIFIKRLVASLEAIGVTGSVVAPGEGQVPVVEDLGNFRVMRHRYCGGTLAYGLGILPNLKKFPWRIWQIPFLLGSMLVATLKNSGDANVMHGQWLISGLVAYGASLVNKKPYVISVRGQDTRLLSMPVTGWLFRFVMRRANAIHVVSESIRKQVAVWIPPEKISLIYNGIGSLHRAMPEVAATARRYQLAADKKYLIYVGRRIALKGVERIFPLLSEPYFQNHELICFGVAEEGFDEVLIARAKAANVRDRVQLLQELPPDEVPAILSFADYIVSGSYSEGRPNGILEGLAAGKLCLVSDIEAHRDIARECPAVILFTDGSVAACVQRVAALDRPALAIAANRYAERFNWQACAVAIKALYEKLLLKA